MRRKFEKSIYLCKACRSRQGLPRTRTIHTSAVCYICTGILDKIDAIAQEMHSALDDQYEFDSFLIGTSLATQFIEREDEVRAKFKIRGMMSIKNHITSAIRSKFRTLTSAREKFEKPDLLIILNIFSD